MVNETIEKEPLATLAAKIAQCANEADNKVLEAAKLIREARKRVEAGEVGEIMWYAWAEKHIKLSKSRLRELLRIAEAKDPSKELERLRKLTQQRVERHRNGKKEKKSAPLRNGGTTVKVTAELDEDRQRLIDWAHSAPLDHVAKALSYIEQFGPAEAEANLDRPVASAAA